MNLAADFLLVKGGMAGVACAAELAVSRRFGVAGTREQLQMPYIWPLGGYLDGKLWKNAYLATHVHFSLTLRRNFYRHNR